MIAGFLEVINVWVAVAILKIVINFFEMKCCVLVQHIYIYIIRKWMMIVFQEPFSCNKNIRNNDDVFFNGRDKATNFKTGSIWIQMF